jgi:hypothetical protein
LNRSTGYLNDSVLRRAGTKDARKKIADQTYRQTVCSTSHCKRRSSATARAAAACPVAA